MKLTTHIIKKAQQIKEIIPGKRLNDITPFAELPSENKFEACIRKTLAASELFSLFTADVIKLDVRFIR
ncbi:MAG TPA: hypothetical protein VMZ03_00355 [Chitinophagaceae bacterium]|nr:hypothetical protein [Chitinophagaceae bacterium]